MNGPFGDPIPGVVKELIVEYIPATQRASTGVFPQEVQAMYAPTTNKQTSIPTTQLASNGIFGQQVHAMYAPRTNQQAAAPATQRIRMGEYEGRDIHGVEKVVSAQFGANGKKWLDVTNLVNGMLNGASLNFSCYYLNSGKNMWEDLGDPLPGQPKELIVEYIPVTQRISMGEYEGRDIHGVEKVVSAQFGANGKKWFDVTNLVNGMLNGASLNFSCYRFNSEKSMWKDLGDPLPGQPKELVIEYIPATQRASTCIPATQLASTCIPATQLASNGIFGQQVHAMYGNGSPFGHGGP
jgi:hypothetical protein